MVLRVSSSSLPCGMIHEKEDANGKVILRSFHMGECSVILNGAA